jgi:hypothetical protein
VKKHGRFYSITNALFHLAHIAVILFVMIGWIFRPLLPLHLALTLLTLGSWFILGHWFGTGYCPISDWHWKLKETLGGGRPNGTYIHLVLQNISRRELNPASVDKVVLVGTVVIAGISLVLNVQAWRI